jgi:hypothetical protein
VFRSRLQVLGTKSILKLGTLRMRLNTQKVQEEEKKDPSIQDLLLAQSQTRPRVISSCRSLGNGAWRDFNKRIKSDAAAAAANSISSIGGTKTRMRPRKREIKGEIGRMSGKMHEVDGSSKTSGVLGPPSCLQPPNSVASCGEDNLVDDKGVESVSVPFV